MLGHKFLVLLSWICYYLSFFDSSFKNHTPLLTTGLATRSLPSHPKKVDIRVTIDDIDGVCRSSVEIAPDADDVIDNIDAASDAPKTRRRHPSTGSNTSSVSSASLAAAPPDGGWGWVVVFASFIAHCIADGCAFSFGIFYMTLKDSFNESDAKTSLVGSIFAGGRCISTRIDDLAVDQFLFP